MAEPTNGSTAGTSQIIRTVRGLSIDGTRMMLYDVMDFFKLDYPRHAICDHLALTDAQIDAALQYIHEHRAEVEAEYQQILQEAEENRRYWEERLREHLARTPAPLLSPEQARLRAKFQAWKAQREAARCNA
ncbi:MAG: DUF433 domain-containing protein [Chloroflexota bacterium]|nr:DUF433 domain-containing protein [Chloroflexota bacterium]